METIKYLEHVNFTDTLTTLLEECQSNEVKISDVSLIPKKANILQERLFDEFKKGNVTEFFNHWTLLVPENLRDNDIDTKKLEFYLQIHFAVYPLKKNANGEEEMSKFREYLDKQGAALSHDNEFLPYYALPFVRNLCDHPSYANLFQNTWSSDLLTKLENFISESLNEESKPRLFQLVENNFTMATQSKQLSEYIEQYNHMQIDYHNLISMTADLVEALENTIRGHPISFDELQNICNKKFSSQLIQSLDFTSPNVAVQAMRQSIISSQTTMKMAATTLQNATKLTTDYYRMKSDLVNSDTSRRRVSLLLQALRWRLTKTSPYERDNNLSYFIQSDILACEENCDKDYRKKILQLLTCKDEIIRQYTARLFNTIASLCDGRSYLSRNTSLMTALMQCLCTDDRNTLTRENVLGCLQKLSLRRSLQTTMINEGIIQWLVQTLENIDRLSDYTVEYSIALLMNLCLRSSGKHKCISLSKRILKVLVDLLEHDNKEIKYYVNGTLYSILSLNEIRKDAHDLGLNQILHDHIDKEDNENPMNRQLLFIIKQLNTPDPNDDCESDDNSDEDDDEQDQESMEADLDKDEPLIAEAETGEECGERLLSNYKLGQGRKNKIVDSTSGDELFTRPMTPCRNRELEGSRPTSRKGSLPLVNGQIQKIQNQILKPARISQIQNAGEKCTISTEYKTAFTSRPRLSRTAEGSRNLSFVSPSPELVKSSVNIIPKPIYSSKMPSSRSNSAANSLIISSKET